MNFKFNQSYKTDLQNQVCTHLYIIKCYLSLSDMRLLKETKSGRKVEKWKEKGNK